MNPADVCVAVLVAVIWGLAFAASRIALNEFSPELMMFDLFAWLCLVASLPLTALTLASNGAQPVWHALTQMSPTGLVCMLLLGGVSTSIAYWLWGRLLRDYPAAQVVPFALLVPFVGSAASSIVFGERFGPLRLAGMLTVIGGIAVMVLVRRPHALPKTA